FHTELDKPTRASLNDFAKVRRRNVHVGVAPLRTIQQIKNLHIEFERQTLAKDKGPAQAGVFVANPVAPRIGSTRRSVYESIGRGGGEGIRIEQAVAGRIEIRVADVAARGDAQNAVRPLAAIEYGQPIGLGGF